jgi:hypothetical protein
MLCQRYYAKTFPQGTAPANNAGLPGCIVNYAIVANALPLVRWQYPVPMRAVPVLTFFNPGSSNANWTSGGVSAIAPPATISADSVRLAASGPPTIPAGTFAGIHVVADAEL